MMQLIKYIIIFLPIIIIALLVVFDIFLNKEITWEQIGITVGGIAINSLYIILLLFVFYRVDTEVVATKNMEYNLVATKFNNNIEGNFFLGSGTINNEEYMYYVIRDGNEIKREKTQNYKIYITNKEVKVIIEKKTIRKTTQNWLFSIYEVEENIENGQCIFYIPEDSIIQNININ